MLDYLLIDFILDKYGLSSAQFKSAISANDLVDDAEVQEQI